MSPFLSLLTFSLLTTLTLTLTFANPNSLSAHSELKTYGFPTGLLPTTIANYTVDRTSREFVVRLRDTCKLTLPPDNYVATYAKVVKGRIAENRIEEIDGIRVRAFFKWWSITGIRLSGDDLVFEVGVLSAKYPKKNFDESPPCDGDVRKADS